MNDNRYIEIKTGNVSSQMAKKIVNKGTVDILISANEVPNTSKDILSAKKIVIYENVDDDTLKKVNSMLK